MILIGRPFSHKWPTRIIPLYILSRDRFTHFSAALPLMYSDCRECPSPSLRKAKCVRASIYSGELEITPIVDENAYARTIIGRLRYEPILNFYHLLSRPQIEALLESGNAESPRTCVSWDILLPPTGIRHISEVDIRPDFFQCHSVSRTAATCVPESKPEWRPGFVAIYSAGTARVSRGCFYAAADDSEV
ncbi:hypothetical protein B0H19DRAFT_1071260 [Mycena capillaripes]|nr:hypothetical protein B0H19DRAFT_1071260 [Mycena capillaripes]